MIESKELVSLAEAAFNSTSGYVDMYAIIDPVRRFVNEILIVYKEEDGSQQELTIRVGSTFNKVSYFKKLEEDGAKDFVDFIEESCNTIYGVTIDPLAKVLVEEEEEYARVVSPLELVGFKERILSLKEYYAELNDELGYYTELREIIKRPSDIEHMFGTEEMDHTVQFWKEHGLI